MRKLLRAQIWIASLLALCACLYVQAYSRAGYWRAVDERRVFIRIAELLLNLKWMVFVVPLCGILMALQYGRAKHVDRSLLVAELLYIFAVAWPLIAILAWEFQEVPIVNTLANP
jgi:hypothetical protein